MTDPVTTTPSTSFQERRDPSLDAKPPGVERRQFSNSHDGLSPRARELAVAIDEYKGATSPPFHHVRRNPFGHRRIGLRQGSEPSLGLARLPSLWQPGLTARVLTVPRSPPCGENSHRLDWLKTSLEAVAPRNCLFSLPRTPGPGLRFCRRQIRLVACHSMHGPWRSLVTRHTGGVGDAGSNPVGPTFFWKSALWRARRRAFSFHRRELRRRANSSNRRFRVTDVLPRCLR